MPEPVQLPHPEVVASLAATRLFQNIVPTDLGLLAGAFSAVRCRAGEVIAQQGQVDDRLWVVVDGGVSVEELDDQGQARPVRHVAHGGVIGQRGVFADLPRNDGAITVAPSMLLVAEQGALWAALRAQPELIERLELEDELLKRAVDTRVDVGEEGEYLVATYRRHWIALARAMIGPGLLLLVGLLCSAVAALFTTSPAAILLLALLALAVPLVAAVWTFFSYWQDRLIITSRSVVHIERTPLIDTHRIEAPLTRVQDVRLTIPGLVARLLGYGTVAVQTAGTKGAIVFTYAPRPGRIRQAVFDQLGRAREEAYRQEQARITQQLRQALGMAALAEAASSPEDEAGAAAAATPLWSAAAGGLMSGMRHFWPKMRVEQNGVVTWRKHWWILIRMTWLAALGLALLTVAIAVDLQIEGSLLPWWVLGIAWVVLLLWLIYQFENWRNDFYQLTDDHIIDVDRLPLGLFEERRQASLGQIQDVRFVIPNPVATLLNFGSVMIETAAEIGGFTFDYVYRPASVQQEIVHRIERHRLRQEEEANRRRSGEIGRWLAEYHRLTNEESTPSPPGPDSSAEPPALPPPAAE